MRIGLQEIIIIIVIIIAIAIIARMVRVKPKATDGNSQTATKAISRRVKDSPKKKRNYLRRFGIAFVLVGIVSLLAGVSMFRWAMQSYVYAFVTMVLGFAFLFLSRKK